MATSNGPADQAWGKLADAPEAQREQEMQRRYMELVELQEADRQGRLVTMANAEYALAPEQLRGFTLSRMRVLLKMPQPQAKLVALSYHAAMDKLPGTAAMRRVSLVQTLATEFSPEDQARLRELNPGIFAGMPAKTVKATAPAAAPPAAKKGGWWPFGKK